MKTKKCQLILIPTEKESIIGLYGDKLYSSTFGSKTNDWKNMCLCVISDDEIETNNWILQDNKQYPYELVQVKYFGDFGPRDKKIITSTDYVIISDVGCYIPELFIETYVKSYNEGKIITEIELEMKDIGGEEWMGDDENGEPFWNEIWVIRTNPDNGIIIKNVK